jgi:hypothetical protein
LTHLLIITFKQVYNNWSCKIQNRRLSGVADEHCCCACERRSFQDDIAT